MKKALFFLLFLSITTSCISQWSQVGNNLIGDASLDEFGETVAMNFTGDIIAVGARFNDLAGSDYGQVKVFQLQNSSWIQLGEDLLGETSGNIGEKFGWDLDINASGTRVVVGSPLYISGPIIPGAARVFEFNGTNWSQIGGTIEGESTEDFFGGSVSINSDGTRIIVGSPSNSENGTGSGQARIFEFNGSNWVQVGNAIEGETEYYAGGSDVSINGLGNRVAVGFAKNNSTNQGLGNGIVRLYELQGTIWQQIGEDIVGDAELDGFGEAISLNTSGNRIAIGARLHNESEPYSGQVKVFEIAGNNWAQLGTDILGDESEALGISLDLNSEGTILVIGGRANNSTDIRKGIVRVFKLVNDTWIQYDDAIYGESNEDEAGRGVAINGEGNYVVIGAPFADPNGESSGQARVYQNDSILSVLEFNRLFSKVKLYPNPNNGIFDISFIENQPHVIVKIVDLLGRQVATIDYFNTHKIEVNENLKAGVYLVEITAQGVSETVRIVVE